MKFDFSIPGYTLEKICMGDALIDFPNQFSVKLSDIVSYQVIRIFTQDPIDDVNNSIILLCKGPYGTDLILISLTSTFITNEMENHQVSFLDHRGNFRIPKIQVRNEEVKYDMAIFFSIHPDDDDDSLKKTVEFIETDFRSHGYTSYRPKYSAQIHSITMSLPKDAYYRNLYIIVTNPSTIIRYNSDSVVSFHIMNTNGKSSVNRFFCIDNNRFLEKVDPILNKEEEEEESKEEICIKNKNILGCYTIILWKKDKEGFTKFAFITTGGGIKIFYSETGNTKVIDCARTVWHGIQNERHKFILVSLQEDVDNDLGILTNLEDAEKICKVIKSQNDLDDFLFYNWNPCIAKIYQYEDAEEDRFVAIYTKEDS